jgi:hypothetical protein
VSLFDAAMDRLSRDRQASFDAAVQSARAGYVFAHDHKAFQRWARSRPNRAPSRSVSGAELEQAVMRVASMFPENVVYG